MFEEGKKMAAIYGAENVYDFSLGNPNVPAPDCVKQAIIDILNEENPVYGCHFFSFLKHCPDCRIILNHRLHFL